MVAELHLAEDALGLHLILQYAKCLFEVIIADKYVQKVDSLISFSLDLVAPCVIA